MLTALADPTASTVPALLAQAAFLSSPYKPFLMILPFIPWAWLLAVPVILYLITAAMRRQPEPSLRTAITLAHGGEFGLLILTQAMGAGSEAPGHRSTSLIRPPSQHGPGSLFHSVQSANICFY